jgi:hypothetical protein
LDAVALGTAPHRRTRCQVGLFLQTVPPHRWRGPPRASRRQANVGCVSSGIPLCGAVRRLFRRDPSAGPDIGVDVPGHGQLAQAASRVGGAPSRLAAPSRDPSRGAIEPLGRHLRRHAPQRQPRQAFVRRRPADPRVATANEQALAANRGFKDIVGHHVTPAEAASIFNAVKPKLAVYCHLVSCRTRNSPGQPSSTRSSRRARRTPGRSSLVKT